MDLLTGRGTVDFVNNVVYNWSMKAIYGGEEGWFNVSDNWFRPGPATSKLDGQWLEFYVSKSTSEIPGNFYIDDNVYDLSTVKKGNAEGRLPDEKSIKIWEETYEDASVDDPYKIKVRIYAQDADEAYKSVLKYAGASLKRDAVDKRVVKEVRKGKAKNSGSITGLPGIIDSENDLM
jgi:hypothetical protein